MISLSVFVIAVVIALFVGAFLGVLGIAILQAGRDRPVGDPDIGRLISTWEGRKRG